VNIVNATVTLAAAILAESVLSFLGFGIQAPNSSWGTMLEEGRLLVPTSGWLVWFPGLAIVVTVLCVNFVGDGLCDAVDPTRGAGASGVPRAKG
jgi:peptide/nickel transport system permease protein